MPISFKLTRDVLKQENGVSGIPKNMLFINHLVSIVKTGNVISSQIC